jgi:hypothetical protein
MSVSTRAAQQTLGFGQFASGLLVLTALALTVAGAIAFGSITPVKPMTEAPLYAPAFIDHGSRGEIKAAPVSGGYYRPDGRGGLVYVPAIGKSAQTLPGFTGDPGFAPRPVDNGASKIGSGPEMRNDRETTINVGSNGPRLRAQ